MLILHLSIRSLIFLEKHSVMGWLILKLSAKRGFHGTHGTPSRSATDQRGPNAQNMMLYIILSTSE